VCALRHDINAQQSWCALPQALLPGGSSDFADLDAYRRFVDDASATPMRAAARRCTSGQAQVTACHRANRGRRRHVVDYRHAIHAL
jgi:hypothetical protein